MSEREIERPKRLGKTKSWSANMQRDAVWLERKREACRRNKSFNCHDLDELGGCFELGFGLDSPDLDPRLSSVFPALEFYRAVTNHSNDSSLSRSSSSLTLGSDSDMSSPEEKPFSKFFDVEDPGTMKIRLKLWAQAVACKIRHSPKQDAHEVDDH